MNVRRSAIAFVAIALLASAAMALDVPRAPTQWLTDTAGLLDASQASALNEKLRTFEASTGTQFIIYIFPSLQGETLEDFTVRCAERWKVGNKKYDNGLILLVFVKERRLRVETGYGLESTITDAFASDVIHEYIEPRFHSGDYSGGLNAAADAIIARITNKETPREAVSPGARGNWRTRTRSARPGRLDIGFMIVLALVFLFVLPMLRRRRVGGGGGCGGCIWPLLFTGGGRTFGASGWSGGGGGGGFGGGGFSGGGGSFGGGGASGGW